MKRQYIFLFVILLAFCIACGVGTLIFGWGAFSSEFTNNLNQPVPLIGISFGTALLFFLIVFSKTKFGKQALEKLTNGITKAREETEKARDNLNQAKQELVNFKQAKEQEVKELTETYKVAIDGVTQEVNSFKKLSLSVYSQINNVNIQKQVNEYVESEKSKVYNDTSMIIKEAKEEARSEYEKEIIDLKAEIEKVKQIAEENRKVAQNGLNDVKNDIQETKEEILNV